MPQFQYIFLVYLWLYAVAVCSHVFFCKSSLFLEHLVLCRAYWFTVSLTTISMVSTAFRFERKSDTMSPNFTYTTMCEWKNKYTTTYNIYTYMHLQHLLKQLV